MPRRALTTALALLAAVVLAACGSSSGETPSASGTADPGAFPVSIATAFGTTRITKPPTRVATVGFNEQDFALALGVKPVAVRDFFGPFPFKTRPWAPGADSDPKPVYVGGQELSIEKVASARPDLILGVYAFADRNVYAKLSGIAPTVVQAKDAPEGGTPWDQQLLTTGRALGREAKARQVVQRVDAKFAAARKAHPEFRGKRLVVAFESGGDLFTLADDDLRQGFFTDLGFVTPKDAGQEGISRERLGLLDQDVLVLISDGPSRIQRDPLFRRLKAVREGRVIAVQQSTAFAGALGYNSPLSRPYLLAQAVPRLAAAVDGDPATRVATPR